MMLIGAIVDIVGFIAGIDENVGRLMAVLEDPNLDGDRQDSILENTLILITSDNGGTHTDNLPLRGEKGMFTEGGIRVPLIAFWKGHLFKARFKGFLKGSYPLLKAFLGGSYSFLKGMFKGYHCICYKRLSTNFLNNRFLSTVLFLQLNR